MDIAELIRTIGETVASTATVKSVYGDPVTSGQRTVIPVATVRCVLGGGGGAGEAGKDGAEPRREGGGGGGGGRITARPSGVVEISAEGVRFLYYRESSRLTAAAALGFAAGLAVGFMALRKTRSKSI